jgi:hypothetical protein
MAQTNNADDALFRWAYQAVNGKSPTDAEMDQAGSNWIITIVPQAIRFNTNEQNMKKELRELISASA